MKKTLLFLITVLLISGSQVYAQYITAQDDAGNYSDSNFPNEGNEGFGFENWNSDSEEPGGWFLGTATNNGASNSSILNTEGDAFGMWGSNFSDVGRNFNALNNGATLSFALSFQWDNGNKGVDLYTGGVNNDQVFNFNINDEGYSWFGGGFNNMTGWDSNGDRQNGVVIGFEFTQTATGLDYRIEMLAGDAGGEAESNYFGVKTGSIAFSGNINAFKFYVSGAGGDGGDLYFNNLQIEAANAAAVPANADVIINGNVELGPTETLTVNDLTVLEGNNLTIKSDDTGTGSLIHNGEGVDAIVEYYMEESAGEWPNDKSTDWYWISAPVTGQAIADFLDGYEGQYDLYRWDESEGSWLNYKAADFNHISFELGTGYLTAFEDERIHKFDGELFVANTTWSDLTHTSGTYEGSELSAGWHLIGNPYASGIVFSTAAGEGQWTQTNVELTPQVWNAGTETYDAVLADEVIESATAFFVRATNGTNTLTIPAAARQHAVNDDKNQPSANYIILAAKPVDSQLIQRSYLRIEPDTDEFFDNRYDSRFRPGNAPIFHSFREEHKLLVNAVSAIHDDLSIPFVFEKIESADEYSINIERSIEGVSLYLVDRKLDKEHLLTSDNPYLFISEVGDAPYRFDLRFAPLDDDDTTNLPDTDIPVLQMWHHNNTLYVNSQEHNTAVEVYDISGRRLQSHQLNAGEHRLDLNLPAGVYIVQSSGNSHHETMKIIIQ